MNRLQGKVAIVTGGGHGIGRAYCLAMAAEGARVVVADIDGEAARSVAEEIVAQGNRALGITTDVVDEASTQEMARRASEHFGAIDILVNNAAIYLRPVPVMRVPVDQIPIEEWDRIMSINVKGTFLPTRAVLPAMKATGAGKIINISSSTVFNGRPGMAHYVTSKAGVIGFTRVLAQELGEFNITANVVAPGRTLSEDDPTEDVLEVHGQRALDRSLPRVQLPEDVVGTILFLASSESDFITGQTIVVDGGAVFH